jgi:hypothetical protein
MADVSPATPDGGVATVVHAQQVQLADYLNQPVRDILARLGLPHSPAAPTNAANPPPASSPPAPAPAAAPPSGGAPSGGTPFDPMQLISPVTDALSTLGSGQFGALDPTQIFSGIASAFDSAGSSLRPAMAGLGNSWQGDAATAATTKTLAAMQNGAQVGQQSTDLGASLSAAVASVAQAQARLIAIINEFVATLAAIGPSIIFPWGIAAAIAAANQAITEATEVITETQGTLGSQAATTQAAGTPVPLTATPDMAAFAPTSGQSFGPLLQTATGLASPAMQAVGAATSAATSAGQSAKPPTQPDPATKEDPKKEVPGVPAGTHRGGGGGGGGVPHGPSPTTLRSRLAAPALSEEHVTPAEPLTPRSAPAAGLGGSPMMGAGPAGSAARGGSDSGHSAAAYLHTTDQGDEIVGDLGSVGPPVIGETGARSTTNIELRI